MKTMKRMPLSTQKSEQHLRKLFLKENEQKTSFWIFMYFYVNLTCILLCVKVERIGGFEG